MSHEEEPAVVSCRIIRETEKALLIEQGLVETWIPRSQLHHISKKGKHEKGGHVADLEMPEWLAEERELEYK